MPAVLSQHTCTFSDGGNVSHIPVNTDINIELKEIVERLEKLPLHPDGGMPDLGAEDEYEEPGIKFNTLKPVAKIHLENCHKSLIWHRGMSWIFQRIILR